MSTFILTTTQAYFHCLSNSVARDYIFHTVNTETVIPSRKTFLSPLVALLLHLPIEGSGCFLFTCHSMSPSIRCCHPRDFWSWPTYPLPSHVLSVWSINVSELYITWLKQLNIKLDFFYHIKVRVVFLYQKLKHENTTPVGWHPRDWPFWPRWQCKHGQTPNHLDRLWYLTSSYPENINQYYL